MLRAVGPMVACAMFTSLSLQCQLTQCKGLIRLLLKCHTTSMQQSTSLHEKTECQLSQFSQPLQQGMPSQMVSKCCQMSIMSKNGHLLSQPCWCSCMYICALSWPHKTGRNCCRSHAHLDTDLIDTCPRAVASSWHAASHIQIFASSQEPALFACWWWVMPSMPQGRVDSYMMLIASQLL